MPLEVVVDKRRINRVLNELTGRNAGLRIEHWDGRVDMVARPEPATVQPDQVADSMSHLRRFAYDLLRNQGHSDEAARLLSGVKTHARFYV